MLDRLLAKFAARELERRRPSDEVLGVIDDMRQELLAVNDSFTSVVDLMRTLQRNGPALFVHHCSTGMLRVRWRRPRDTTTFQSS